MDDSGDAAECGPGAGVLMLGPNGGVEGILRALRTSSTPMACHEAHRSNGGVEGIRTPDPLLAKQVLYQLSYNPMDPVYLT